MAADLKFSAQVRTQQGKAHAAALRREGKVPGVVYGQGGAPQSVVVAEREVEALVAKTMGRNSLLTMELSEDGKGAQQKVVMFKELQREPVKSKLVHVDFYLVDMNRKLKLKIPVVLEGMAEGVKEGGILQHATRSLNVRCLPSNIPASIKVDISHLKLDESILLEDVAKQEGVDFLDDAHSVLAHVAAVEEEVVAPAPGAEAGATAAQPEVIGEKEREAKRAEKEGAAPAAEAKPAEKGAKPAAAPAAKAPAAGAKK